MIDTKYMVFDFGGTLADYENMPLSWADSYSAAFAELQDKISMRFTDYQIDAACNILKKYNPRINPRTFEIPADKIFDEIGGILGTNISGEKNSVLFYQFFQKKLIVYSETKSVLETLKNKGGKIAVLSDLPTGMSHSNFMDDIKKINFEFDMILSSQKVGYRKPEIKGLELIAEEFGCSLESLFFIGDEKKDMDTIRKAGGTGILIDRKKTASDYGQKYTINSLLELDLLLR